MEIYDIAIVPLIVGVTQLVKMLGLPNKFAALCSAVLGVVAGVVYISPEKPLEGVLIGLSLGLASSGLYSGTKNTVQGIQSIKKKGQ